MLRNCPTCGRLLTTPPGAPCPHCLAQEDEAMARIAAYLDQGGRPSFADVVAATGVAPKVVRRLVDQGRLVLADYGRPRYCALCGRPLSEPEGRICAACARQVRGGSTRPAAASRGSPGVGSRSGFYSHPAGLAVPPMHPWPGARGPEGRPPSTREEGAAPRTRPEEPRRS